MKPNLGPKTMDKEKISQRKKALIEKIQLCKESLELAEELALMNEFSSLEKKIQHLQNQLIFIENNSG